MNTQFQEKVLIEIGQRFGRLVVTSRMPNKDHSLFFLCKCDCGNEKGICKGSLVSGDTRSCGCLKRETSRITNLHHGMSNSPEYRSFAHAKERCHNPRNKNYASYGGRGIKFHAAWINDFAAFYAYVGPRPSMSHSLERKNTNGHYEPGNIEWATAKKQANNTRRNVKLSVDGREMNVCEWAEETGIPGSTIWVRIYKLGWSAEKAVTTPVDITRRNLRTRKPAL